MAISAYCIRGWWRLPVAGSVGGARGRINARKEAGQKGAQQAVQANQQGIDRFKKAASASLEARGYSVR